MRCWRSYLSEARCKWPPYGPAYATATRSSFSCQLTQVVQEKRSLNKCPSVCLRQVSRQTSNSNNSKCVLRTVSCNFFYTNWQTNFRYVWLTCQIFYLWKSIRYWSQMCAYIYHAVQVTAMFSKGSHWKWNTSVYILLEKLWHGNIYLKKVRQNWSEHNQMDTWGLLQRKKTTNTTSI